MFTNCKCRSYKMAHLLASESFLAYSTRISMCNVVKLEGLQMQGKNYKIGRKLQDMSTNTSNP